MKAMQPKQWRSEEWSQHKVADYKPYNFVDGEGVRCSLYVSGCLFACEGCYNKIIQNFNYGQYYTKELEDRIISDLGASYCQGLTLLGGEPFLNTKILIQLCQRVRETYGDTKDIWAWSGYTWDELMQETEDKLTLLSFVDVLVDGRFILSKCDLTLRFRGSSNQRIIDVKKSRAQNRVVLYYGEEESNKV
ncbi:anaerobic ribonucleoside-triphosphate reductase activating protein [Aerococcaceae bacterium zg-BR22]|uniref:anaerobic ribonucleoside-triphosphate reductase activating protein n=1 Tax=Aerococcaceae bacterium zg-1292 TaxID=2774330 RepID=UPI004063F4EC|nr:anaerobic ribonucleoside-triphosphate reductase activating protein [Aerococcaceae bacterium zg-BR22]